MLKSHIIAISLLSSVIGHSASAENVLIRNQSGTGHIIFLEQLGDKNYLDSQTTNSNNDVTVRQNGTNLRSNVYAHGKDSNVYEEAIGSDSQFYILDRGIASDIQAQANGKNNYTDVSTFDRNSKVYAISKGDNNISMISARANGNNPASYAESLITGNSNRVDNYITQSVSGIHVIGDGNKVAANVNMNNPNAPRNSSFIEVKSGNNNIINTVVTGSGNLQGINVNGSGNQVFTNIAGNNHIVNTDTNGTGNSVAITQKDNNSIANVSQNGSGNVATIIQGQ